MKTLLKLAAPALVLAMGSLSSVANADVSGSTKFSVEIPNILVLYHWDSANIKFNDFEQPAINDSTQVNKTLDFGDATLNASGGDDVDVSTVPAGFDTSNQINVKLKNSWAVRSLSGTKGVNLKVETPNGTDLINTSIPGSKVTIGSIALSQANATLGNNTNSIDLPSGWTAKRGDIDFKLNLGAVTESGVYSTSGTTAETFKLTLSAK